MTEKTFRLVLGALLWGGLVASSYFETMLPVNVLVMLLLFEGVTNWRVPILISHIRYGKRQPDESEINPCEGRLFCRFEAERMLRFIVIVFVIAPFYLVPEIIWFMPWFVAGMLILAGITNICPMVTFLRWSGMR